MSGIPNIWKSRRDAPMESAENHDKPSELAKHTLTPAQMMAICTLGKPEEISKRSVKFQFLASDRLFVQKTFKVADWPMIATVQMAPSLGNATIFSIKPTGITETLQACVINYRVDMSDLGYSDTSTATFGDRLGTCGDSLKIQSGSSGQTYHLYLTFEARVYK